jgi:ATP-dependent Clp protease ATP-binding subunit ClpA
MQSKLSPELEEALEFACNFAQKHRQEFAGLEHVFLGLLNDQKTARAIRRCGGDLEVLKQEIETFIIDYIPPQPEYFLGSQPSITCFQLLDIAQKSAQASGQPEVSCIGFLICMYRFEESHSIYLLQTQGVSSLDLKRYVSHYQDDEEEEEEGMDQAEDFEFLSDDDEDDEQKKDSLSKYVIDLNERAEQGLLDPMIGRKKELERTIHILARRRKNNPILVGEAGVGKTAIAEGLALAIYEGKVPDLLKESLIYSLDVGSLVAGTRYRGDFEDRIKKILKQLKKKPNVILFIDEIHTFIGAGSVNGGALDASSIFKPLLARGELRCIGATTWTEYRNVFEKDQAFARRFQKVEINEPSIEECIDILQGLKSHYEEFHSVSYTNEALDEAARLSSRYFHDRFLPDKAIDVIDEAGASSRLADQPEVSKVDIENTIALMASIPAQEINTDDRQQLRSLESDLKQVVFGQDEAVGQVVSAVKLARAGLGAEEQPLGAFLFTGPTGVGKTEVARQLASTLGIKLIRFDMSEYMERHTVSRLIGAPPGYVGFDQGGLLTDAVTKSPHCVLLLDEIEKAHPEVFNLLLQVMDHGTLTDNNGKKSDFRNVILIMTSNIGAQDVQRNRPGFFSQGDSRQGSDEEAFKRTFSPEFRNRLHARVRFAPLSIDVCLLVARKMSMEMIMQLAVKEVEARFTQSALETLMLIGYDPLNGARPMQRMIREHVKRMIADDLLFGGLVDGGALLVDVSEEWRDYVHGEIKRKVDAEKSDQSTSLSTRPQKAPFKVNEVSPLQIHIAQEALDHKQWDLEDTLKADH